jgi:pimeloyl-ACP methyl ester carboxylesterase
MERFLNWVLCSPLCSATRGHSCCTRTRVAGKRGRAKASAGIRVLLSDCARRCGASGPPAIPLIGDILRYTVSPLAARLTLNKTVKGMFAPQPVPPEFLPALSREMLVRPMQIRANAEDAAFMIPAAAALQKRYVEMTAPAVIFAGEADPVVDPDAHARRLHSDLSNSGLHVLPRNTILLSQRGVEASPSSRLRAAVRQ